MKLKTLLLTSLISLGLAISYPALADELTQAKEDHLNKVYEKFRSEWRIVKAKDGWTCEVYILQDRDGNVLKSNVSKCNTDDKRFIRQTKKAVKLASPFPRASDEVFTSELILNPTIKGDVDVFRKMRKRALDGDPKAIKAVEVLKKYLDKKMEDDPAFRQSMEDTKERRRNQLRDAVIALKSGDSETAFKIWLPFAERGNSAIQWNVGSLYYVGEGVDKNTDKAFYWFEKSAEKGYHAGQHSLGKMYQDGAGVTQDIDKAVYWYKKAAKQGNKQAREILDEYNLNYEK
jgi:hypothetical protein